MIRLTHRLSAVCFALLLALALAACGGAGSGGGGGGGTTSTDPTEGIVANNFFYVSAAAVDDTGDGLSASTPKLLVQSAIGLATAGDAVLVATGTYSKDYNTDGAPVAALVEGVSLYGGFSANFTARNTTIHLTTMEDLSAAGGTFFIPNRAVAAGAGITAATIVDGFSLLAGGGDRAAAVAVSDGAAPIFQNNTISGNNALLASFGIHNNGASPTVTGNTIDGGTGVLNSQGVDNINSAAGTITGNPLISGGEGGTTNGIRNEGGSTTTISFNTISGGNPVTGLAIGVLNGAASPTITANTIDGGVGAVGSRGISNSNGSSPSISGNTINGGMGGAGHTYGIENATSSAPLISGNTIDAGSTSGDVVGIIMNSSSPTIFNNVINGGSNSGNNAIGIWMLNASAPSIRNNTVGSGTAAALSVGIRIQTTSSGTAIQNNIVFTAASGIRYCVQETSTTTDPTVFANNNLFDCPAALYRDEGLVDVADLVTSIDNSDSGGGTGTLTGRGTVSVDAVFADASGGDYSLTASSPEAVTEGGLNFANPVATVPFSTDRDGVTRLGGAQGSPGNAGAAGWSMGAYEYDVVATPRNLAFVTSTTQDGNLGGLAGADTICQTQAAAAGLHANTYLAWLSTSTVDAVDRLAGARGWVRPDGRAFTDTAAALTSSGTVYYPLRLDEFGVDVGKLVLVYTGTNSDGSAHANTCSDWGSNASSSAGGYADAGTQMWSDFWTSSCSSTMPIYCFGSDYANAAMPMPPPASRVAFLSSGGWAPGGTGIGLADSQCQAEATTASLANPGNFMALLAPTGATAASRFNLTGDPWVRTDDVLIGLEAADLQTDLLFAPINILADGSFSPISDINVWVGAADLATAGTNATNCTSWISTGGSGTETRAGISAVTFSPGTLACFTNPRIFCLED